MRRATTPPPSAGNVLLIEDDDSAREMFAYALEVSGWTVRSAADGLSGVRMLEVFRPDVIVLDMWLPIADGANVLERLRSLAQHAPVVAISGYDDAIEKARAHPNVLALIRKPFLPDELVRTVERAKQHVAN